MLDALSEAYVKLKLFAHALSEDLQSCSLIQIFSLAEYWRLQTSNCKSNTFHCSLPTQGGIISKLRRRLTVQGESETIDGVLPSRPVLGKQESDKLEDVSLHRLSTSNHSHLIFLDRLSFAYESLVFRFYDLMASITSIFAAQ